MQTTSQSKNLSIINILTESWSLLPGLKWPIFQRILLFVLLPFITLSLIFVIFALSSSHGMTSLLFLINFINILFAVFSGMNCWIPATMMGLRRAINLPIDIKLIKPQFLSVKKALYSLVVLYAVMISIATFASRLINQHDVVSTLFEFLLVGLVCAFYIPIQFFAIPLIITRKLNVADALDSAIKITLQHWKVIYGSFTVLWSTMFGFYLFEVAAKFFLNPALIFLGMIGLCISSIWLTPMTFTLGGVLFREIYGLKRR